MLDTVLEYQNLLENIDAHITESSFKKDYFIKELGVSRATFYNKLKNKSFTVNEMLKISALLFPEEFKAFEVREGLRRSRADSYNGRIVDHNEVMTRARKKIMR